MTALTFSAFAAASLLTPLAQAQAFDQSQGPVGATTGIAFSESADGAFHIERVEVSYTGLLRGLRFTASNAQRTLSSTSPWMGSEVGTLGTFDVPNGDLLTQIGIHHDAGAREVYALDFYTSGGARETIGIPRGTETVLSLQAHEIVGFHGFTSPFVTGLGIHLRPAWESTKGPYGTSNIGTPFVVDLRSHVSTIEFVRGSSGAAQGIRFEMRDDQGVVTGSTPWFGQSSGTLLPGAIEPNEYLRKFYVGSSAGHIESFIVHTNTGRRFSAGQSSSGEEFVADSGHEIVGVFGTFSQQRFKSVGVIQRPLASRSWEIAPACSGSGGQLPSLSTQPPRVVVGLSVTVTATPGTVGVLFLDSLVTSLPIGACTLAVHPANLHVPLSIPSSGAYTWTAAFGPAFGNYGWDFLGLELSAQALVLDSGAFSVSEARSMVFGGL